MLEGNKMFENPKITTVGFDTDKIGEFELEKIKSTIEKAFNEILKKTDITSLKIHLKIHSEAGGRHKYSTHAHIITTTGAFDCEDFEWNAFGSVSKTLEVLEKQVKKHISKKTAITKDKLYKAKEIE